MSDTKTCQRCGAPLGPDAPEGLCPRCLMGLNLSAQTDAPTDAAGPGGTKVVPPQPPPLVAEIAAHFPQLEIIECLGRGGMGVVYKARQPKLDRFVALKVLAREKEQDPHFAERFQREARALARLNHPNIVAVYDFGETDGLYYLLMEFVDGVNLRQLLRAGKMTPDQALGVVPPICDALQYAHKQGIVHRDIKPENILLDKNGRVKIADFGIARILGTDGLAEPFTADQQAVGTPHYMAPEQVEKPKTVDHRADIYSLGVVFYEMLTGELPLGKFAPPSQKVHIDVRLDEVVLHALEKEPARRYQQVGEVKTDLDTIARDQGRGMKAGPRRTEATPPVMEPSAPASAWQQVKGPATGLIITGILNWVAIPLLMLITALNSDIRREVALLLVPLAALVIGGTIFLAGLLMKRLTAYWLVLAASLLAILTTPGNLIGLPIGIWALVVLSRREVREAFGKGLPIPGIALDQPNRGRSAWKVAAVIVAALMLVLVIPVCAILLATGLTYNKVRSRARLLQEEALYQPGLPPAYQQAQRDVQVQEAGPAPIAFDGLDWLPWRTLFEVQGDKLVTLPKARPGFNYGKDGNGRGPVLMSHIGDSNWRDYRATFEYCVTGVDPSFNPYGLPSDYHDGGIFFHVADAKENWNQRGSTMYVLEVNGDGSWFLRCTYNEYSGTPIGYQYVRRDAERKLASGRGLKIDRKNGNKYVVEIIGQRIQVWVDGKQIADVTDSEMGETLGGQTLDHGGIGFAWGMDTMGWIRNVSLTRFEAGESVATSLEDEVVNRLNVKRGSEAWASGDYAQALRLLLPAAEQGDPVAQHRLGVMYVRGDGVDQDYAQATRWLRKAADQGQGEAQFSMGLRYLEGQAVPQDYKEAARWFRLAADQGVGMAASRLAELYATGRGVPQDFAEAYLWLTIAGTQIEPGASTVSLPELARKLRSDQLADAQRRAQEFVPKRVAPADL